MDGAQELIDNEGANAFKSADRAMASLEKSADAIDQLLVDNRVALSGGIRAFGEFGPALQELRDTLVAIRRVTRRLDDDPAEFLTGRQKIEEIDHDRPHASAVFALDGIPHGFWHCYPHARSFLLKPLRYISSLLHQLRSLPHRSAAVNAAYCQSGQQPPHRQPTRPDIEPEQPGKRLQESSLERPASRPAAQTDRKRLSR